MISGYLSCTRGSLIGLLSSATLLLAINAQASDLPERQVSLMSSSCANCHGTDGKLAGAIPAIAGRPASVLEAQLLAFKQDLQPNTTVMNRIAKGYTDEELKSLANYFANVKRK